MVTLVWSYIHSMVTCVSKMIMIWLLLFKHLHWVVFFRSMLCILKIITMKQRWVQ